MSCWWPRTRTGSRSASSSPAPTARRRRSCPSGRSPRRDAPRRPTRRASVEIFVDESQVSFRIGGLTLTSRLIEGEFPNYRQLLPEQHESRLDVSRQQLLDAVRRVGLLARDTTPVRLEFNALGVKLSSSSPDLGQAVETVEARYEGEDLTVAFNPQYLADGLTAATASRCGSTSATD